MTELLGEAAAPTLVGCSVGERILIARGPLKGLVGQIVEIDGDEVLVDLRGVVTGLLIRCPANQLAAA